MKQPVTHLLALFMTSFVLLCTSCSDEKEIKEAVLSYHFDQNNNEGAGQLNIHEINFIEKIERNDTIFVLVEVAVLHTPPPLSVKAEKTSTINLLWYIMLEQASSLNLLLSVNLININPNC